jgi:hypothetical protein
MRVYCIILGQCDANMQAAVMSHHGYQEIPGESNPIKLLSAIQYIMSALSAFEQGSSGRKKVAVLRNKQHPSGADIAGVHIAKGLRKANSSDVNTTGTEDRTAAMKEQCAEAEPETTIVKEEPNTAIYTQEEESQNKSVQQ